MPTRTKPDCARSSRRTWHCSGATANVSTVEAVERTRSVAFEAVPCTLASVGPGSGGSLRAAVVAASTKTREAMMRPRGSGLHIFP
jgi:hypothetical protein